MTSFTLVVWNLGCSTSAPSVDAVGDQSIDLARAVSPHDHYRVWYRDADGDGRGDGRVSKRALTRPLGFVANGTDCDDQHTSVYPGASELPSDGLDDDCDGAFAVSSPQSLASWEAMGDHGNADLGTSIDARSDFDGDGNADLALGGSDVEVAVGLRRGLVQIHSGPLAETGLPVSGDSATAVLYGASDDQDSRVCGVGDLDGDGADDLVIGHTSTRGIGAAYLVRGPFAGEVDTSTDGQAFYADSSIGWSELGYCAGPGDVDGDGAPDVLIGDDAFDGFELEGGVAYLLRGPAEQTSLNDADMTLAPEEEYEYLGGGLAALGDITGDGAQDFAVSNMQYYPTVDGAAVYLVTEYVAGTSHPRDVGVTVHTEFGEFVRGATSRIGDVDGDGYDDLAVGEGKLGPTRLFVLKGPFGEDDDLTLADDSSTTLDSAGPFATSLIDWNGIGSDVLAIADLAFGRDQGVIYLMAEPIEPGSYDVASVADQIGGFATRSSGGLLGGGLDGGSDVSGDGIADFVFASPGSDYQNGRVYVLFGGDSL